LGKTISFISTSAGIVLINLVPKAKLLR